MTYFRGFNALRFYAALSVVVQHVSYSPHDWFRVQLLPITLERFFLNGADAVNLFFVLSGFLITYLLINERERTGTVSIRKFYIRRAFRIYPVYFIYLLVVFFLLQPPYSPELILLLIFFMGNLAFVTLFPFPPLDHLWSIGVEEQYYLIAPILARYRRYIAHIALGIIVSWWVMYLYSVTVSLDIVSAFLFMSRYDLIALGALLAYAYYHKWGILGIIGYRIVLVVVLLIIGYAIIFVPPSHDVIHTSILGVCFAILIYHLASAKQVTPLLDNRLMESLGKLSYSMYVYHPLFVLLFYSLFFNALDLSAYQLLAYPLIIAVTILVSWLSYTQFESRFLSIKDRFSSK